MQYTCMIFVRRAYVVPGRNEVPPRRMLAGFSQVAWKPGNAREGDSAVPLQHTLGPRSCTFTAKILSLRNVSARCRGDLAWQLVACVCGGIVKGRAKHGEVAFLPSEVALLTHPWTRFDSAKPRLTPLYQALARSVFSAYAWESISVHKSAPEAVSFVDSTVPAECALAFLTASVGTRKTSQRGSPKCSTASDGVDLLPTLLCCVALCTYTPTCVFDPNDPL